MREGEIPVFYGEITNEGRQLPPFVCYLSVKDWNFTLSHKDTNYFSISLSYTFFEYTTATSVAANK